MPRYVAAEGGRFGEIFDQRYIGPDGKRVFPDEFGAHGILTQILVGTEFPRFLEHEEDTPKPESRTPRRVQIAVMESFLASSRGEQVLAPYRLSDHDVPPRVRRLVDEFRDPSIDRATAKPRQLTTVLKHGASRKDWSNQDPWVLPEQTLGLSAQIVSGLVSEGFIDPHTLNAGELEDLLAQLSAPGFHRFLSLPRHKLLLLAQQEGWGSPTLGGEYRRALEVAELLNTLASVILSSADRELPW